jgi:hypothetical protein
LCFLDGSDLSSFGFRHEIWRGVDMDSSQFDELVARIARGLSRREAVKGLTTGALASAGIGGALAESADAAKKKGRGDGKNRKSRDSKNQKNRNNNRNDKSRAESESDVEAEKKKKRRICHCPDGNPANCVTKRLKKKAAKKHLKRHQFDYKGACVPAKTCSNNSECAPQVCVDNVCRPCTNNNQCDAPAICNEATGNCEAPTTTTTPAVTTTTPAVTTTTPAVTTTTPAVTTTTPAVTTTTPAVTTTTALLP